MRTLITTFGPDPENTLAAMRAISYERLALVLSEDDLNTQAQKIIRKIEEDSRGEIDNIFVDQYDLKDCFRRIVDYVLRILSIEHGDAHEAASLCINISGGSKIMGDAALIAAIHTGVRAFHCEKDKIIKFPVIEGVTLKDRLSDSQLAILKEIGAFDSLEDISRKMGSRLTDETIKKSLRKLKKMGIVKTQIREGGIFAELTESGIFILETINRLERGRSSAPGK